MVCVICLAGVHLNQRFKKSIRKSDNFQVVYYRNTVFITFITFIAPPVASSPSYDACNGLENHRCEDVLLLLLLKNDWLIADMFFSIFFRSKKENTCGILDIDNLFHIPKQSGQFFVINVIATSWSKSAILCM